MTSELASSDIPDGRIQQVIPIITEGSESGLDFNLKGKIHPAAYMPIYLLSTIEYNGIHN